MMTRDQARRVLDQVRAGDADYSAAFITMALFASGDMAPVKRKAAPVATQATAGRVEGWAEGRRRWHRRAERTLSQQQRIAA